ncbi:MAG TPA: type II and III secretion system protein family protein [Tepidisphaeraceae bacterium]|nr:type II and III secretion system protein family protein [Tepidisphaeraceae bacterium]
MNIANQGRRHHHYVKQKSARRATKLAAWSVLAGLALCSAARGADAPASQPASAQPQDAAREPASRPSRGDSIVASGLNAQGVLEMMANKSAVLTTRVPYKTVSPAQPDIADVNLDAGPSTIIVFGKKPGATQIVVLDDQGRSQVINVVIAFDLQTLQQQINKMFPKAAVTVTSANGLLVLRGHVPDLQTARQIAAIAAPYSATAGAGGAAPAAPASPAGGEGAAAAAPLNTGNGVLNFLEVSGGQQVMLQVRFAEVSRSASESLGFNAFLTDGKARFGINSGPGGSPVGAFGAGQQATIDPTVPLFGAGGIGNTSFEVFIDALRANNLLRVLAEPNLTCTSGEHGSFLAGGEFPIPVPQPGGGAGSVITVEYKQFGVQLNFVPTVLGNGRVRLDVKPIVSDLDYTNSVTLGGFVIPSLTTRSLHTTVELGEGQTFALAGLLQTRVNSSKNVTPLLGDVPVLGALFRSVRYTRNETELVVLVTPRLVEPMNPRQVPSVPGEKWRFPSETNLFLNQDLGGPAPDSSSAPAARSSRFYGATGFHPAPAPKS